MSGRREFLSGRARALSGGASETRVAALVRELERIAPETSCEDWWPEFEGELVARRFGHPPGWPHPHDLRLAVLALRCRPFAAALASGPPPRLPPSRHSTQSAVPEPDATLVMTRHGARFDEGGLAAARMARGDGVAERWVWGAGAAELQRRRLATLDEFRPYRWSSVLSVVEANGTSGLLRLAWDCGENEVLSTAGEMAATKRGRRNWGNGNAA